MKFLLTAALFCCQAGGLLAQDACPTSHPYAYYNGQYCCASDTEKTFELQGAQCDGSKIQLDSLCCLNDQYYKCPSGNCYTAENLYDSCIAYTEEACIAAGMNLGLEIGSDFNAGPSTNKGCYAYNNKNGAHGGKVFFGASENIDELAAPIKEEDQFRPIGHDCKKPNIIFLMADDMGYNDIGYNNPHAKTPKMDQLAKDGITLKHNYLQTMCTPSRIAFLSGMYPYHVGRQENVLQWGSPTGLSLNRSTIADGMKKLGYDTYAMGKWHVGDCHPAYLPINRGFDQFYGLMGAMEDYVTKRNPAQFSDWWDTTEDGKLEPITKVDDPTAYETHNTYLYQARFNDILSKYQDDKSNNPFFMFLAMQHPHTPFEGPNVPGEYRDKFNSEDFQDDTRYKDLATYDKSSSEAMTDHLGVLGLTSMLDDLVGNVIEKLKNTGLYDNTIFVFSSDNGGMASAQVGNYPYRGFKTSPQEGGTKVPAFIHSPLLPTTEDFSGINHVTDWYPTFMRLGGEPKAYVDGLKFDGVDQLETLFGGQVDKKARTQMVYNIRNEPFWNDFHHGQKTSGWIRDGDFKYGQIWVYDSVRFDILYDLKSDPTEKFNVAVDHPDQLKKMSDLFDDLAQSMVPADEPTCADGACFMPPRKFLDGVGADAILKEGWCGYPDVDIGERYTITEGHGGEKKTIKQWPLYYDPCTSGPCSTKPIVEA